MAPAWNGWLGPTRNGRYDHLPEKLPKVANIAWEVKLARSGLGGIAANHRYVLLGDRDGLDFNDVFRCYDAQSGERLWEVEYLAIGKLDYGNSPRATPLIVSDESAEDRAILLGAFGDLRCVRLHDGKLLWKRNLRRDFKMSTELPWGYCGSPLIVDGKVMLQAGGPKASLVALNLSDGELAWQSAGRPPSYGSLTVGTFGGRTQLVGHDSRTLGGWDTKTGKRLWELPKPADGDFHVPTPIVVAEQLLVATENQGVRLYRFHDDGTIDPKPLAQNHRLTPNMSSAIVVGNRVFCVNQFLYCLDLSSDLKELYRQRDPAWGDYGSILADDQRLLVVGKGELLLLDAQTDRFRLISRLRVFDESLEMYSFPALVGNRLYLRGESALRCIELE